MTTVGYGDVYPTYCRRKNFYFFRTHDRFGGCCSACGFSFIRTIKGAAGGRVGLVDCMGSRGCRTRCGFLLRYNDQTPIKAKSYVMRLSTKQIQRLKKAISTHFGENASVRVFGSRVDDSRRGGDYDFYVETTADNPDEIITSKLKVLVELHASPEFEDEKIDLVVRSAVPGPELAIYKVAREEGVRL